MLIVLMKIVIEFEVVNRKSFWQLLCFKGEKIVDFEKVVDVIINILLDVCCQLNFEDIFCVCDERFCEWKIES